MRDMNLDSRFPGVDDLKWRAQARLPKFVWEYLDSGTGREATKARNRKALDALGFHPAILEGTLTLDLGTRFLGQDYDLPVGSAPIGMSGLIWADAEGHLARAMAEAKLPFTLSTVASQSPEDLAPHIGDRAWFQLYPPKSPEIRADMVDRARRAGFRTLVLTVDLPAASRRERQTRSGLTQPPRLTPRLLAQVALRPSWAIAMAQQGRPSMRSLEKYIQNDTNLPPTAHIGYLLRTSPDLDYVRWLRDNWDGALIIKGVMRPQDAAPLAEIGVDALWVSNHAGRQFDGAPAAIDMLPPIRAATTLPIVFDSGIEGGLDVLRALALGADFVMLGRAFQFALAALGPKGPAHLLHILHQDMISNMSQIGVERPENLPRPIRLDRPEHPEAFPEHEMAGRE